MIANSLTPVPKLLTLGTRYNKRVVECRLALVILATKLGKIHSPTEKTFATFYELQKSLGYTFDQMLVLVKTHIKPHPYTPDHIRAELGVDILDIVRDIQSHDVVLASNSEYFLYK